MSKEPEGTAQLKIRLPEALRQKIEAAARAADRTINAEMVRRLRQSFEGPPPGTIFTTEEVETLKGIASHPGKTAFGGKKPGGKS
jgi:hypothetical protein